MHTGKRPREAGDVGASEESCLPSGFSGGATLGPLAGVASVAGAVASIRRRPIGRRSRVHRKRVRPNRDHRIGIHHDQRPDVERSDLERPDLERSDLERSDLERV